MPKEITMPKLSDTMTEGLFAGWRRNIGDRIERGDVIAEVETDKAVMELEAFASGILTRIFVTGGETVPVGTVLGLIGEAGEPAETAQAALPVSDVIEAPVEADAIRSVPSIAVPTEEILPAGTHHDKASPLVRRMAREQGINLDQIQGSGPEGRITREDLTGFHTEQQKTAALLQPSAPATAAVREPPPVSSMRQAIAAAVSQSWSSIPHFTVTIEICMEACREIVSELKSGDSRIGYNALVIKACAVILEHYPLLLSAGESHAAGININFAVALPDGLLMPVIRQCQNLSAAGIELEVSRLTDKSREGRLLSGELSGGCFSVSNLGMFGVDEFAALIMPGQVAILAVGAVKERPLVRNGQLVAAPAMRVTLSSDHRIIDGAYAASFLAELRAALERPVSLLLSADQEQS